MMKWMVDGSVYDDVREAAAAVVDGIDEGEYDDYLDEVYDEVEVCGHSYSASTVLKEVDPTAYRCGFSDWTSELEGETEEDLTDMEDGDAEIIRGVSVECIDEEDDGGEDEEEATRWVNELDNIIKERE